MLQSDEFILLGLFQPNKLLRRIESVQKLRAALIATFKLVVADLGEGAAQLDVRRGGKLSLLAHGERAGVQAVQVGHHQQQVGRRLHRQETAAGDIHPHGIVEALDGGAHGRLQLDDVQTAVQCLQRRSGV